MWYPARFSDSATVTTSVGSAIVVSGVASADDTIAVDQVCVQTPEGRAVPGAVVSRVGSDAEMLLGTSDATGCVAIAPTTSSQVYQATVGTLRAISSEASGGVVVITLSGRSVTMLDSSGQPLAAEIRTFAGAWSDPAEVTGSIDLPPDPTIEAVEIRWAGMTHVQPLDGDVVVVLATLVADPDADVVDIDRGLGWEPFVDGIEVLPGRVAVRLDNGGIAKLDVPGDHAMSVPSGTITRLDLAPAPPPATAPGEADDAPADLTDPPATPTAPTPDEAESSSTEPASTAAETPASDSVETIESDAPTPSPAETATPNSTATPAADLVPAPTEPPAADPTPEPTQEPPADATPTPVPTNEPTPPGGEGS